MTSQNIRILNHLRSGKWLTPLEALQRFGCMRLGARIYDLRQDGHPIQARRHWTPSGKFVAKYYLP